MVDYSHSKQQYIIRGQLNNIQGVDATPTTRQVALSFNKRLDTTETDQSGGRETEETAEHLGCRGWEMTGLWCKGVGT